MKISMGRTPAIALLALLACPSAAIETFVHSPGTDHFNEVGFRGSAQSRQGPFTIKIIVNCFSARRRPVFNPISPVGSIHYSMSLAGIGYHISFPSWTAKKLVAAPTPEDVQVVDLTIPIPATEPAPIYSNATISSAFATHNLVLIRSKAAPAMTVFDVYGNYSPGDRVNHIDYLKFKYDQRRGSPCSTPKDPLNDPPFCTNLTYPTAGNSWPEQEQPKGLFAHQIARLFARPLSLFHSGIAHAGLSHLAARDERWRNPDFDQPGWGNPKEEDMRYTRKDNDPLTPDEEGMLGTMVSVYWSPDMRQMEIDTKFPAANNWGAPGHDWCAGYFSPLMLFFDDSRPQFKWMSNFKINEYGRTAWPEPGAPGYFLALDQNEDGLINDVSELFGDQATSKNGFTALAYHDSNKDNVIDAKDPVFHHLILWRALNGDGVSQDGGHGRELYSLADLKVKSISLNYNRDRIISLGPAQFREASKFKFKDSAGRERNGEIIDVWLSL